MHIFIVVLNLVLLNSTCMFGSLSYCMCELKITSGKGVVNWDGPAQIHAFALTHIPIVITQYLN